MANDICRIRRWAATGEHIFETEFEQSKAVGSTIGTEKTQDEAVRKETTISEQTAETPKDSSTVDESLDDPNSEAENVHLLVGCQDDVLIPSLDQIHCTFLEGQSIWRTYVTHAASVPFDCVPTGSLDPYILLQKIPPLPQDIPRKWSITGEAIWHVACPEFVESQGASEYNNRDWDPEYIHDGRMGRMVLLSLYHYGLTYFLSDFSSYKKRQIQYSLKMLSPIPIKDLKPQPDDIVIYLECASRKLTRWLCAVLAPGFGWQVVGPLPPWSTHYQEYTRFIIATDTPFGFLPSERPPSSCEATDLFIELCTLFDFGSSVADHNNSFETLQQPTIAFLAALILPLYNEMGLHPQLPRPSMNKAHRSHATPPEYIRDYVNDLQYFMTLSILPASVGSIIWSMFWEPGLDCNLVSAWFASILDVIKPIIKAGNLEVLVKIFMARRQSPALLWLGVFVLGDLNFLNKIICYLETHDEQPGGSWSWPDIDVTVWTGSKQSFLDEDILGSYKSSFAQVPRSDLLRSRFNFRLGDPDALRFGWQPFGHVIKHEIEPELWPRLEDGSSRKYKHWIWWLPDKDKNGVRLVPEVMVPDIQRGFRCDKVGYKRGIVSHVEPGNTTEVIPDGFSCNIMLVPSRAATFHIISYGSKDAAGDRSLEAMVIPRIREHPWMADSRVI